MARMNQSNLQIDTLYSFIIIQNYHLPSAESQFHELEFQRYKKSWHKKKTNFFAKPWHKKPMSFCSIFCVLYVFFGYDFWCEDLSCGSSLCGVFWRPGFLIYKIWITYVLFIDSEIRGRSVSVRSIRAMTHSHIGTRHASWKCAWNPNVPWHNDVCICAIIHMWHDSFIRDMTLS